MKYTNYTNIDSHFRRAYEPGDRLVRGYSGTIDGSIVVGVTAEQIFMRHNADDRPDGQLCPSMSVGDVVIIGEVAMSVDSFGWKRVDVALEDIITDRTWKEMVTC